MRTRGREPGSTSASSQSSLPCVESAMRVVRDAAASQQVPQLVRAPRSRIGDHRELERVGGVKARPLVKELRDDPVKLLVAHPHRPQHVVVDPPGRNRVQDRFGDLGFPPVAPVDQERPLRVRVQGAARGRGSPNPLARPCRRRRAPARRHHRSRAWPRARRGPPRRRRRRRSGTRRRSAGAARNRSVRGPRARRRRPPGTGCGSALTTSSHTDPRPRAGSRPSFVAPQELANPQSRAG